MEAAIADRRLVAQGRAVHATDIAMTYAAAGTVLQDYSKDHRQIFRLATRTTIFQAVDSTHPTAIAQLRLDATATQTHTLHMIVARRRLQAIIPLDILCRHLLPFLLAKTAIKHSSHTHKRPATVTGQTIGLHNLISRLVFLPHQAYIPTRRLQAFVVVTIDAGIL
jgi:uncharacterized MnhB-related membrane protein